MFLKIELLLCNKIRILELYKRNKVMLIFYSHYMNLIACILVSSLPLTPQRLYLAVTIPSKVQIHV